MQRYDVFYAPTYRQPLKPMNLMRKSENLKGNKHQNSKIWNIKDIINNIEYNNVDDLPQFCKDHDIKYSTFRNSKKYKDQWVLEERKFKFI